MDRGERGSGSAFSQWGSMAAFIETLPIAIVETDVVRRIQGCNRAFGRLLQRRRVDLADQRLEDVMDLSAAESARLATRLASGERHQFSATLRRRDGSVAALDVDAIPYALEDAIGSCCIVQNAAALAASQHARRLAEEKFARAFLVSPSAKAISTADNHLLEVNDTWVRLMGYSRVEAVGRTPAELNLFENPADFDRISAHITHNRQIRAVECRFRARDGGLVIGALSAEEFTVDGERLRLLVVEDLTALRRSQADLSRLTRLSLEGRDQERARMAAELHDDVGQRLSLLRFGLERLLGEMSEPTVRAQLETLSAETFGVVQRVRTLSHSLMPPTLRLASVETALRRLCEEVASQSSVPIDFAFRRRGVPSAGSPQVTTELFRILQEALANALKHSGTARIDVTLWELAHSIFLKVRDFGTGFDPAAETMRAGGLGLLSMRERVQSLNGQIRIVSAPAKGTTIRVQVPLSGA